MNANLYVVEDIPQGFMPNGELTPGKFERRISVRQPHGELEPAFKACGDSPLEANRRAHELVELLNRK